jgi:hypothetical protein
MIRCLACDHENDDTAQICASCETPLFSMAVIDPLVTETLMLKAVEVRPAESLEERSELFERGMVLNIRVHGDDRLIRIRPSDAILFGRSDPRLRITPEVDLTEYDGARRGVSRVHAAMRVMDRYIVLIDMGSSNGTFHNGERALPRHPRLVRDGDQIQLGEMVMSIRFSN